MGYVRLKYRVRETCQLYQISDYVRKKNSLLRRPYAPQWFNKPLNWVFSKRVDFHHRNLSNESISVEQRTVVRYFNPYFRTSGAIEGGDPRLHVQICFCFCEASHDPAGAVPGRSGQKRSLARIRLLNSPYFQHIFLARDCTENMILEAWLRSKLLTKCRKVKSGSNGFPSLSYTLRFWARRVKFPHFYIFRVYKVL